MSRVHHVLLKFRSSVVRRGARRRRNLIAKRHLSGNSLINCTHVTAWRMQLHNRVTAILPDIRIFPFEISKQSTYLSVEFISSKSYFKSRFFFNEQILFDITRKYSFRIRYSVFSKRFLLQNRRQSRHDYFKYFPNKFFTIDSPQEF